MPPVERAPSYAPTPDEDPSLVDDATRILCADFVNGIILDGGTFGLVNEVDPTVPFRLKVEVDAVEAVDLPDGNVTVNASVSYTNFLHVSDDDAERLWILMADWLANPPRFGQCGKQPLV